PPSRQAAAPVPEGLSLGPRAAPVRVLRRFLAVLLDPALDLGMWNGENFTHCGLEPRPRLRACDVFRLGLHGLIMTRIYKDSDSRFRYSATCPRIVRASSASYFSRACAT